MSRYGRISDADKLDRYYTPRWATDLLLNEWAPLDDAQTIGEPCAGIGHIVEPLEERGYRCIASDIDPESPYEQVDATSKEALARYAGVDCIVTNPPYSCDTGTAFEVLENLVKLEVPIAMLLRLNFLEPPKRGDRKACYQGYPDELRPVNVVVLPRVNYHNSGDSNPATSCWMTWRPDSRTAQLGMATTLEWKTIEDVEALQGQTSLLEVAK